MLLLHSLHILLLYVKELGDVELNAKFRVLRLYEASASKQLMCAL